MTGTTFKESDLKFKFSSDWWVVQYDDLAGVAAAARNSTHLRHEWQRVLSFLQDECINVEIVLWLEEDTPPQYDTLLKRKTQAIGGTLSRRVKQRLGWLTSRVFVCSISENKYAENLDVAFL